ncbi:D-serine deaminase, pyridoxal phosphate-dependent [Actinacidiphila yanglinensis]|uniref:D-serine deaminase, pyridoxal phosphate-dependent n=1 Tax=Actinacidiphila yanglinensis TaxID=310779 RepID=A0A1H5UWW1_9ACTN|nr:alanine racemase [Actinacidiphila yanglinensis]SEF79559.1 D-serine deaminase, pyridoxal phosphate-dependent [Actinacidiphila yanglinensis]
MDIDERIAALDGERVDHRFKGVPADAEGLTVGELAAQGRSLFDGGFGTPVLALSEEALEHNLTALEEYTAKYGLRFAPHGKTSMAPQLFARQLARGAWGITLAMPHQVRVARAFGVPRIFLANELVDAAALRWIGAEQDADPDFSVVAYVDSLRGVELMDATLRAAGVRRALDVVVELGAGQGARTGVRTGPEAEAVAAAVAATGSLRLVGVAGYEGEVPGADPERVRAYLRRLVGLAATLDRAGRFADAAEILVSAGGSAWFDAVADVFTDVPELSRPVLPLLRSGAYVTHDDDHYRQITPFNRVPQDGDLQPAFRLWAQVVSRPAPDQAFLNAGKRDAPYDLGLPVPRTVRSARDGSSRPAPEGLEVAKLSDQHAWLRVPSDDVLEVGDWVALGLSHPCTTFDKWPLIPVTRADGTVTSYVRTFF